MGSSTLARKLLVAGFAAFLMLPFLPGVSVADNATVLPEGVFLFQAENRFFFPVTSRFNTNGDAEPLGAQLSRPLVSPLFGLPAGANLGNSQVDIEVNQEDTRFLLAYGLTDRLTLGARIRYFWSARADVNTSINTAGATFGLNPGAVTAANPFGLAPLAAPGTTPITVTDLNKILVAQGFQPISDWQESGVGDLEIGGRYQYYRSNNFRAAFTGAVRAPTGETDDPNNLVDYGLGDGAWALIAQLQQDWIWQRQPSLSSRLGFPLPGDFFFTTHFQYDLVLPDQEKLRVCPVSNPVCSTLVEVDRDLGDLVRAEVSTTIGLWPRGLVFTPLYRYDYFTKTDYSGPAGVPVELLEINSAKQIQAYKLTLTYTTIPLVVDNKFPVPINFSVTYRERFAGDNNVFKSRYVGFDIAVYLQ